MNDEVLAPNEALNVGCIWHTMSCWLLPKLIHKKTYVNQENTYHFYYFDCHVMSYMDKILP